MRRLFYFFNRFALLCGQFNEHLKQIEQRLGIRINHRGSRFELIGSKVMIDAGENILRQLYAKTEGVSDLSPETVHLFLQKASVDAMADGTQDVDFIALKTRKGLIKPRGLNQQKYIHTILENDISFGIGPAGTDTLFDQAGNAVKPDQFVQCVIQWTQVRVNFLRDIARQESQFLTGFYGRAYQKNTVYLLQYPETTLCQNGGCQ
jgi:phosphate starvation-inducible protein PhoH